MLMLTGLTLCCALLLGVLLDCLLGETRRWHPLIGFGKLASLIEQWLNHANVSRYKGGLAWVLCVLPIVLLVQAILYAAAYTSLWLAPLLHAALLYVCLGLRSLREHNLPIQQALDAGDLAQARQLTGRIVSRDTAEADAAYLSKASVESVLENGCDAVFGTLFWFLLLGGAGAVLYRLSNTLDAMWGYRSPRFLRFGCVAARVDDVLNLIPARLTALSYALLGNTRLALHCWRTQTAAWPSPNAGPVMAAGAGALGVQLGGSARYDGQDELRPPLGAGRSAAPSDILAAWHLVWHSTLLWLGIAVLLTLGLGQGGIFYA